MLPSVRGLGVVATHQFPMIQSPISCCDVVVIVRAEPAWFVCFMILTLRVTVLPLLFPWPPRWEKSIRVYRHRCPTFRSANVRSKPWLITSTTSHWKEVVTARHALVCFKQAVVSYVIGGLRLVCMALPSFIYLDLVFSLLSASVLRFAALYSRPVFGLTTVNRINDSVKHNETNKQTNNQYYAVPISQFYVCVCDSL